MPVTEKHRWTIDEVERLIGQREGYTPRYELVDGELLVTPSPNGRHQRIVAELFRRIDPYVRQHRLGEVRLGPGAVMWHPDDRRGELLDGQLVWRPEGAADALTIDVGDFFAAVADEP